jgi:hypothetical protein
MGRPLSRWRKKLKEGSGADDLQKHLAGKLTHGIIEEPMLSPLIPLSALIELRKFLIPCTRLKLTANENPSFKRLDRLIRQPRLAQKLQPADESRKHENQSTSFICFNNIPR